MAEQQEKKRKPKARSYGIVMGCIDERLSMLAEYAYDKQDTPVSIHVSRLRELTDELSRALNGNRSGEEEA